MRLLVTGGAGFIGANFCHHVMNSRSDWSITVLDKLTYAGRRENLEGIHEGDRFRFLHGDICDPAAVALAMKDCDAVVNFAAETHVDRSIDDTSSFVRTDVEGVRILLEEFRLEPARKLFLQISTDEVYGSVASGRSLESDPLEPRSPYSASKAGGELLAMSYGTTFGVPVAVTRASNNYGPYQYPEKLIPLFITNVFEGQQLPLYGDGGNIRDWLHVSDHCRALEAVIDRGVPGRVYNIGAGQGKTNLEVTTAILEAAGGSADMIRRIEDRPGHDRRYALDISRISSELGWSPEISFERGIQTTVRWYTENREWWQPIRNGEFREYYRRMYNDRLQKSEGIQGK